MTRIKAAVIPLALVFVLSASTVARQALPALTAPVNDFANVIDPASEAELDKRIRALETATKDAVVVATVKTFAPYGTIEEYAVKLFERSGIGQKQRDNGALIVLALEERKVRIEVGYELEEFITDGFAGEVIRREMLPEFRGGRYGAGLLAGTTAVINRIAERRGATLTEVPKPAAQQVQSRDRFVWIFVAIIGGMILFQVIGSLFGSRGGVSPHRRRRGGSWSGWSGGVGPFGGGSWGGFSGRGGGGSFGGFGGGRSGGGGASGGW
jgi:uncharacterized protein